MDMYSRLPGHSELAIGASRAVEASITPLYP